MHHGFRFRLQFEVIVSCNASRSESRDVITFWIFLLHLRLVQVGWLEQTSLSRGVRQHQDGRCTSYFRSDLDEHLQ